MTMIIAAIKTVKKKIYEFIDVIKPLLLIFFFQEIFKNSH